MNSAINETTNYGVWFRLRFERVYEAMLTTPLTVTDIAVGEVVCAMLSAGLASFGFFGVIAARPGLVTSAWSLLAHRRRC